MDEPVHAFSYINDTLEQLSDTEADSFRSAVIFRIPDLITLSRLCFDDNVDLVDLAVFGYP